MFGMLQQSADITPLQHVQHTSAVDAGFEWRGCWGLRTGNGNDTTATRAAVPEQDSVQAASSESADRQPTRWWWVEVDLGRLITSFLTASRPTQFVLEIPQLIFNSSWTTSRLHHVHEQDADLARLGRKGLTFALQHRPTRSPPGQKILHLLAFGIRQALRRLPSGYFHTTMQSIRDC